MLRHVLFSLLAFTLAASGLAQSPADGNEGLRIAPDSSLPNGLRITWWGRSGHSYFIQHTQDLTLPWLYLPVVETGADAPLGYGFSASSPRIFFRLRVTPRTAADPYAADFDDDGVSNLDELLHFLDPLDGADRDGDGFPDDWERFYFGDTTIVTGTDGDQNNDGITDWEAWLLGLNPAAGANDHIPPLWTQGGGLVLSEETASELTFTWPGAVDDKPGAVRYVLYRNGQPEGSASSATSSTVSIASLTGWHRWYVRPVDVAGNYGAPSSVIERRLGEIIDAPLHVRSRSVGGVQSPWGVQGFTVDGVVSEKWFSTQEDQYESSGSARMYEPRYTNYSMWKNIRTRHFPADAPIQTYDGAWTYADTVHDFAHREQGAWDETGAFSGQGWLTSGGEETYRWDMENEPATPTFSGEPIEITETIKRWETSSSWSEEELPAFNNHASSRTITLSDEVTDERIEGALHAKLAPLDEQEWGSGSFCASRTKAGRTLSLTTGEYKVHLPVTEPGRRYRVRWLEVFFPSHQGSEDPPRPRAQVYREALLAGTGEAVESEIYTLAPPEEDGTVCLVAVDLGFDAPRLLSVNDNFDERVPAADDEEPDDSPWTPDNDTPSPVRADGSLALQDLEAVWFGSDHLGSHNRFGPETTGARLVVETGASRVRLLAVAPSPSGPDDTYAESDWAELESGQELWGQVVGRRDENDQPLPDRTIYLEGLDTGAVVLRLEIDRYGETLTKTRELHVVRVGLRAIDPETGDWEDVGAWLDDEAPRPEVEMEVTSAHIRSDGALVVNVAGHVRDQLGELYDDPARRVAGLLFRVNGVAIDGIGGLASMGSGPGTVPWQTSGSRVPFTRQLVIPGAEARAYMVEARSTPNLAGRRGWAKTAVLVSSPVVDDAPPPPSADVTFALAGPLSSTAADTLRVYRGLRAPSANDPLFVETGANTRIFVGQWTDDHGQVATAHLQLGGSPSLDPDREEWIDAVFTWIDAQQQSHRVEGAWKEPAPAAAYFVPEEFAAPDAPRELRVQSIQALEKSEAQPPRPVLVKIDGLPSDTPADQLDIHLRLGAGEESLKRLPYDGGGWFLTRPSTPANPAAILGASLGWQSPGDEVRLLREGYVASAAMTMAGATPLTSAAGDGALDARARATGARGEATARAYLEAEGYYDEDPPGPADREPLTMDELRGWTLLAFGRPAYLAMILFEEKRAGVVEFVDMSWWSPLKKMRGYELSALNQPLKIQIDANLEPLRAAEVFMEALTDFLGQSQTREEIVVLYADVTDSRFTAEDREMLSRSAFRAAWTGQLGKMETLLQAQEMGIRIVFAPVDMVVTVFEAVEGDRVAMVALAVAVTPIDNVIGIGRKLIRSNVVEQFAPALQANIRTILEGRYRIDRIRRAEVMLGTGSISVADWHKLVELGVFKQSKKYSRKLARQNKLASGSIRPPGTVLHHYLPLDKRFEMKFILAGLDPNDIRFTDWVDEAKHIGWHKGTGPGGKFNQEWAKFFAEFPNANANQIIAEYNRLRLKYQP